MTDNPIEINARIQYLYSQREAMANECVVLFGVAEMRKKRIEELEAELKALKEANGNDKPDHHPD